MANEQNLRPSEYKLTQEEQKKGGIKSGEVRRKKKLIKEQMELLLSLPLKDESAKQQMQLMGIDADNADNQMAMIIKIFQKALKGDVKAFNTIRDTIGEKPREDINISGNVNNPFSNLSTEELRSIIKDE